ncbi:Os01g0720801 [Oryza sativa Japonica Group]|uniref:Os01g0720801 protein n=1 Tax=Oryza sativa subsp. japonica TaxID=39947 RepID=A0A0N7KDN1_ORYSJ|nr:Os01g0720801 [Oryza sativa Japonica Group]
MCNTTLMLDYATISEISKAFASDITSTTENNRREKTAYPLIIANMLNKSTFPNSCWTYYWKNSQTFCPKRFSQQEIGNPLYFCLATKHAFFQN